MSEPFPVWLKRRRKELDLTQVALAERVSCAPATIRKLEAGSRRPSKELVERLTVALDIPAEQRGDFRALARHPQPSTPNASLPTGQKPAFHNLLVPTTPLIGRVQDVFAVRHLLSREAVRLLTIVGPPGIGKTRLSLQVASDLRQAFADGVAFISLVPIRDPQLVGATLAQAFGILENGSRPILERLKESLGPRHTLLVLDNFEHVVEAAPLVAELLAAAPRLKVLVTSRVSLRLYGEHKFQTPPLAVPDLARLPPLEELASIPAVALFVQRAQAATGDFALTAANAPAVAAVCVRLDGIPLALELAAARIELYSPEALLARLHDRLSLLAGGALDLPERQRTLRATLEWSYHLLQPEEQVLFRRLGVFVGGWTAEAAEAVCGGMGEETPAPLPNPPAATLECLTRLIEHSLVQRVETRDGALRFTVLEMIREYALEQLAGSGELADVRRRHADYYLALAESAAPRLKSAERMSWLARLDAERDNLRAALTWSRETPGADEMGLRFTAALWPFWWAQGYHHEGRGWLETMLRQSSVPLDRRARAEALMGLGLIRAYQGDHAAARIACEESVALWRELGDRWGLAHALRELASVWRWGEGYSPAQLSLYDECVSLCRQIEDSYGLAMALNDMGAAARAAGEDRNARRWLEQSLALFRSLGDGTNAAFPLLNLGLLACRQGHHASALAFARESAALFRTMDNQLNLAIALNLIGKIHHLQGHYSRAMPALSESLEMQRQMGARHGVGECLHDLGYVAGRQGHREQAAGFFEEGYRVAMDIRRFELAGGCLIGLAALARAAGQLAASAQLVGAAEVLLKRSPHPIHPMDRLEYDRIIARVRTRAGEAGFAAAWAEGQAMAPEEVAALTLALSLESISDDGSGKAAGLDELTAREREVLQLLAAGLSNAEIARRLVVSPLTINAHLRAIYAKLGVHSRAAAIRFAFEQALS